MEKSKDISSQILGKSKSEDEVLLNRIAVLIGNIEQMYHQNFLTGFNSSIDKIRKKCRAEFGDLLIQAGIENAQLKADRNNTVVKRGSNLPTIYLHFHHTPLEDAINNEQRAFFEVRNSEIQQKVDFINSSKNTFDHDMLALKREYLSDSDGFIFRLKFETLTFNETLFERIDFLISELDKLSLDAAVVMLDQIDWLEISNTNPFLDFSISDQEMAFTFINLKNHLPSRSMLYFLKSIKSDLESSVIGLKNEHTKIIDFEKSYNEVNGSFLKIKLRIQ